MKSIPEPDSFEKYSPIGVGCEFTQAAVVSVWAPGLQIALSCPHGPVNHDPRHAPGRIGMRKAHRGTVAACLSFPSPGDEKSPLMSDGGLWPAPHRVSIVTARQHSAFGCGWAIPEHRSSGWRVKKELSQTFSHLLLTVSLRGPLL